MISLNLRCFLRSPLPYHNGAMPIAVLPSLGEPGSFEVYCSNSTDIFPNVAAANLLSEVSLSSGVTNNTLLRYTTRDFRHYSEPHVACTLAGGIDWKSIARDDASGRYVMIVHYDRSSFTYVSDNAGLSFRLLPSGEVPGGYYGDKDDLNLIHNKGRFVDMQIVYQEWTLRYCDNAGCDRRRVISTKTSSDGGNWSVDQGLIQPDAQDPPELQFYRIRPFYVGNTSRLAAHVFTYAPSPQQSIVGEDYGLQPSACSPANDNKWAKVPPFKPYNSRCENGGCCHGPHLFEEWWIGPQSGDAAVRKTYFLSHFNMKMSFCQDRLGTNIGKTQTKCVFLRIRTVGVDPSVTRTARRTTSRLWRSQSPSTTWQVATAVVLLPPPPPPPPVFHLQRRLLSTPMLIRCCPFHREQLLWVGWGHVYTLPAERVSGIYAPANGEFSSPVFTMPNGAMAINSGLYLNAAARWHGKVVTGGCDEGCAACAATHIPQIASVDK